MWWRNAVLHYLSDSDHLKIWTKLVTESEHFVFLVYQNDSFHIPTMASDYEAKSRNLNHPLLMSALPLSL